MTKSGFRTAEKRNGAQAMLFQGCDRSAPMEDSACSIGADLQCLGFLISPPAGGVAPI
jgi:hypothetical protein